MPPPRPPRPSIAAGPWPKPFASSKAPGQTAAGIYSTGQSVEAIFNSRGVAAWHAETMAQFSITAMAADSSGWAKASRGLA